MDSQKVTDPLNRGMVGGLLGMPADMLNMLRNGGRSVGNLANRLAGVNAPPAPMVENPVYGQEWWGNKMQQAGYVSPNRNKLAEFGAGLLDPGSVMTDVPMLAKGLFGLGDPVTLSAAGGLLGSLSLKKSMSKLDDLQSVWKKSGVDLDVYTPTSNPDLINVARLVVPKELRGQGIGSAAMKDLAKHADESGKTLALSPSTDFGGSSVSRLKEFYKQFGFVENKGKNKDFAISESMYRPLQNIGGKPIK